VLQLRAELPPHGVLPAAPGAGLDGEQRVRCVSAMCAHTGGDRRMSSVDNLQTTFFVDSMALRLITRHPEVLVSIDQVNPHAVIDTVSGSISVEYIGTAGINVFDQNGSPHYLEIPDAFVSSKAKVDLYPVQLVFKTHGATHHFDDINEIRLNGARFPFASTNRGFPLKVVMGRPLPGAIRHPRRGDATACAAKGRPRTGYDKIWRRLAFPSDDRWRAAVVATEGVFPPSVLPASLPTIDRLSTPEVLKGRMNAQPVFRHHHDLKNVKPGDQVYLDTCGPLVPSLIYQHTNIVGVVCPASGYSRIFPCKSPSMANATASLALYIADLRAKLGAQKYYAPLVVRTDGGSAFVGGTFKEFCRAAEMHLTTSAPHVPQQNSYAERLFGIVFPIARMLLASAKLGVHYHPWALVTANWIHNRMPSMSREGKSPYEILTGTKPNLSHLRTFGCAAAVFRCKEDRTQAKHEKKLTADRCVFGIYLGPSETMPAHVIYTFDPEKVIVSPHVIFNEDSFPGDKRSTTNWEQIFSTRTSQPPAHESTATSTSDGSAPIPSAMLVDPPAPPDPNSDPGLNDGDDAYETVPLPDFLHDESLHDASMPLAEESGIPATTQEPQPNLATSRPQRASVAETNRRIDATRGFASLIDQHSRLADPRLELSGLALLTLSSAARPAFAYLASAGPAALPQPDLHVNDCRIPKGYRQACLDPRSEYWMEAIHKEWTGIMANQTLDFVPLNDIPPTANIMNCHYVFDLKLRADHSVERFKARLVANGSTQKFGIDYDEVFATTVKMATIRIMLTIAAIKDYGLYQLDVKQAFLQADLDPSAELYMRMPPNLPRFDGKGKELVCKLKKSLYGLKQAAREWANRLLSELINFGFRRSVIDTCLYIYQSGKDVLYLLSWVDDLIILYSSKTLLERFIEVLGKSLPLDDKGELEWVLKMEVLRDRPKRTIVVSQTGYVNRVLEKYSGWGNLSKTYDSPMDDAKDLSAEDCPEFGSEDYRAMAERRTMYMSVVGSLLWLSACSRPDLTYTTSVLARYVSNPGATHYKCMLRVLAYLHHTQNRMLTLGPTIENKLEVYSDASWLSKLSVSGGIIFYRGCAVCWWSRRQRSVSHSSAEAEYFAASSASREAIYVRDLLEDLGCGMLGPTPLLLDSKAAINLAADPVAFKKTKHILRAAHELRDRVAKGLFTARYVEAANQLADIMTKALRVHLHRDMLNRILPERKTTR
jgi:hypothetical protein